MFNNVVDNIINTEEIPVSYIHLASEENPPGTQCWLIESQRDPNSVKYWAGYFFTPDLNQATRFCRKQDGDMVIEAQFSLHKAYKTVNHLWL